MGTKCQATKWPHGRKCTSSRFFAVRSRCNRSVVYKTCWNSTTVVMYSMRRGLLDGLCMCDGLRLWAYLVPHANHASRSRLPWYSRAVTIFLIDLLFGVSYLFYTFCIGGLTLLSLSVTTIFCKEGGCGGAGLRSGFDPVAVWLCRT
jgi:hypothetical protein